MPNSTMGMDLEKLIFPTSATQGNPGRFVDIMDDSTLIPGCAANKRPSADCEHTPDAEYGYWVINKVGCMDVWEGIFPFGEVYSPLDGLNELGFAVSGTQNNIFNTEVLARITQEVNTKF